MAAMATVSCPTANCLRVTSRAGTPAQRKKLTAVAICPLFDWCLTASFASPAATPAQRKKLVLALATCS
jgi:hypothetical protein